MANHRIVLHVFFLAYRYRLLLFFLIYFISVRLIKIIYENLNFFLFQLKL
jgi:hypothetical protein